MKSNQERSNECLPPKKREIPASTIPSAASSLPSEERPLVVAQASESQRGENLAWLASVVSVHEGREQRMSASSLDADGPQYKPLSVDYSSSSTSTSSSSSSSSSSITSSALTFTSSQSSRGLPLGLTTLPAIYSSPFSQPGGAIQYTPLPHNVHFITPPYAGPYAGYISPLAPPPPPPPPPPPSSTSGSQRSSSFSSGEAYSSSATNNNSSSSSSSKLDQHHHHHHHQHHNHQQHQQQQQQQQSKGSDPATQAHSTQYIPVPSPPVNAPRTSASPHGAHGPLPHHQHTLAQLVLQYSDSPLGPKKEMMNGALEKNRRFGPSPESKPGGTKGGSTQQQQQQQQHHQPGLHHYEARHVVLPAEYAQDVAGLRTSLMFVPNSHGGGSDPVSSADKLPDKGGICSGKPVTRTPSSSSSSSSHPFLPPPLAVDSHKGAPTVIQTTHSTTEALSLGLPSASFYTTQQPIIGYISGAAGAQTPLGYHSGPLPHHLLIPGTQPVIIPVSGSGPSGFDPVPCSVSTATSTCASSSPSFASSAPLPHTFLAPAPPKGDSSSFEMPAPYPHPPHAGQVMQAQLHLPLVQTQLHLPPAPLPPAAPPSLPPYFAKGSIIQLADGELKRVEDLGTEDFLQSAEISADLRIDSSTVERISGSPTPNYAIVQFAVGEHRAQVSVEVLMEYPFFVFGQGWSSCCPERTTQTLELPCTKLSVGDVCISLSLRNLKNGALKKNQNQNQTVENQSGTHYLAPPPPPPPLKPPKASLLGVWGARGGGGGGGGEKENGQRRAGRGGASGTENGELRPGERGGSCRAPPDSLDPDPPPKPVTRKRRWSAPEGRKVERPDGEHPLAPPKALFLSREVKISIEGHSSMAD